MSNKLVIIVIGILLIFVVVIGAGLFMMWNRVSALDHIVNAPSDTASEGPGKEGTEQNVIGPLYSLDTFIVNLSDPTGNRFLRATMDLELQSEALTQEMEKRLPQIRDMILMTLPSRRFQDIQSSEGKIALRNELTAKLNSLLKKNAITNIYFTEFVVQ
jgi:flagellar FliL protein